jgi:hypothetical protein
MNAADLLMLAPDAPILARTWWSEASPQEYDCGCIAVCWIEADYTSTRRLVHACDSASCEHVTPTDDGSLR